MTETTSTGTGTTTGETLRPPESSRRTRRLRRLAMPLLLTTGLCLGTLAAAGTAQAHGAGQGKEYGKGHGKGKATAAIVETTKHGGRTLALTFDDGPDPADTPELLRVLRKHRVKAVFCLWGDHVRQHPELVRAIVRGGHTLCNHSMHHDDMGTWTEERIRADLERTSAEIRKAAPGAPIPYFRAPYGSWGKSPQVAASLGMQPLGWRLVIGDWEPPGTDELVRRITEGVEPGAVILMHDGGGDRSQTVEAVDRVVPQLRDEGWRFTRPARRA
ncbi:polysaccharide deacetylase family protein [Streptomyces sp. TRM 70361]|uniref:polysaccharide deacetylase family protein n=1 Tax=Streptomyces sp. TRM 70361 TaxID=3116553 RepID=UPI002E7C355E|nr:polysaccharide deacetylase family protein [Streptomyces sp. TRM 70361]MEE1939959.1 polysaccharide deacetylase family protein [Streptomyces sp. TRM 70361]